MVGLNAGTNTTGLRNFLAGTAAGTDSTVSDLIIIGCLAGNGGFVNAGMAGSVIVGNSSFPNNADCVTDAGTAKGAITVIGFDNFPLLVSGARMAGTIAIGAGIAPAMVQNTGNNNARNILIGNSIWQNNAGSAVAGSGDNTLIGQQVGSFVNATQMLSVVVIGSKAFFGGSYNAGSVSNSVVIGANACNNLTNGTIGARQLNECVVIGTNCAQTLGGVIGTVVIGYGSTITNIANGNITAIGHMASGSGDYNTTLGSTIVTGTGARNVFVGMRSSNGTANPTDIACVATFDGTTQRGCLYADMNGGNVILGNSASGTNRDFAGSGATNIVKLLNGTVGNANPIGGGYFYVSAGALHYVGTNGTDTLIAAA